MHVIGTAGHVDHGKSTLVEALTGIDPDRLREEKEREMTIDLGFAWLTLPNGESVGIVDVPGHRDFIENMLAGVGGIDAALFVVAVDEGVMPQTREHLAILDLLGIPGGVIALTKTDLVDDPEWLELVRLDVEEVVAGTVLDGAPIVPVSARTGDGLDELMMALTGCLANRPPRPDKGRPRLPIDRVFTISGFGTVVTGTLADGALTVGQEVEILPAGLRARIRGLQTHKQKIERAVPGSRVAVNLSGVERRQLARGDLLTIPGWLHPTVLTDVRFRHLADTGRPLKHNAGVKLFVGAAEVLARVRVLGAEALEPGEEGWLQLQLERPLPLVKGDRFILRYPSPGMTIGGGEVIDPAPGRKWRRFRPEVIRRLELLSRGSPQELLIHVLDSVGFPQTRDQLAGRTGLSESELDEAIRLASESGEVFALGDGRESALCSLAGWDALKGRIVRELRAFHESEPLRMGMPREALRSRLKLTPRVFADVIERGATEGAFVDDGTVIRLPGHAVRFTEAQARAVERLMAEFAARPYTPPSYKESAEIVGEDVLKALIERGDLVQVAPDVLLSAEVYREMTDAVRRHIADNGSITAAELRDMFETTRKYAIGLLEHLDAIGVTRRVGDERVLARRDS